MRTTQILLFVGFACVPVLAQEALDLRMSVPANASVRSRMLPMVITDELDVRLEYTAAKPTPIIRVFVHHENSELVGIQDPDAGEFRWSPAAPGKYYVLLVNTTNTPAAVRITSTKVRVFAKPRSESAIVRVFYTTNREPLQGQPNRAVFGTEPSPTGLSFGHCDVSIPRDHRLGELEGPSIFRLEFRADPEKHVTVASVTPQARNRFFQADLRSAGGIAKA